MSSLKQFSHAFPNYCIESLVTGPRWKENCHLIQETTSHEILIIDPGDEPDEIINLADEMGGRVTRVLLTHPHFDHMRAAKQICEYFDLPCEFNKKDLRIFHHSVMYSTMFNKKKLRLPSYLCFEEELSFSLGKDQGSVIPSPGHTPGSISYHINNFVFTGDTLFYKHIGDTNFTYSSLAALSQSVDFLLETLPDETIIFPGHGKDWTIGEAKTWWQQVKKEPPQYEVFQAR